MPEPTDRPTTAVRDGQHPNCPHCTDLLDELDHATRALSLLNAQLAARGPVASDACMLCVERWRALAEIGEDACPGPETHCMTVRCECACHDLPDPWVVPAIPARAAEHVWDLDGVCQIHGGYCSMVAGAGAR
jgi:hypothetical protein